MEKFEGIIGNITTNNYPTFTNDEILGEEAGHNKALHVSVKCMNHILARVKVDNSSLLKVMPKAPLAKLSYDGSFMKPSIMVVRAFDRSPGEVIAKISLSTQIYPITFEVTFQIMDITPTYNGLQGRPWRIHCVKLVPSTLH